MSQKNYYVFLCITYYLTHKLRSTQSTNSFKSLLKTYLFTIAFP